MKVERRVLQRMWTAVLAAAIAAFSFVAMADEFERFGWAKNAFDSGNYEESVSRFEKILKNEVSNPALVSECHMLLAVSYLFVGDKANAEFHFNELLTLSPDYSPDPLVFPIEVIDFFTEIKAKNKDRLAALVQARAEEKAKKEKAEQAKRKADMEKLKRNVYLERKVTENSFLVAAMPLGAGQFQNGDTIKGVFFLTGELVLGASALTTFILHEGLRSRSTQPFSSPKKREEYERLEIGYRVANQGSLVALAVLTATGIVDAIYNFRKETESWRNIDETNVPTKLRPGRSGDKLSSDLRVNVGPMFLGVSSSF